MAPVTILDKHSDRLVRNPDYAGGIGHWMHDRADVRTRLLMAATKLVRMKGYAATTVDDLCREAGVTKGAFFHHFASKEALGVAAAENWASMTGALFAAAPYHRPARPLDRVLAYIDFRSELLAGDVPDFTCLVGTMVQEVYRSNPAIRAACEASICGHAATLEADIEAAMADHGGAFPFTAKSLALHTQAVLQGAFVLAKATGGNAVAAESVAHLKRYVALLFHSPEED
jgi:TetR/AcrR family transcriptional regulator, transcriptional repressor for nem operon